MIVFSPCQIHDMIATKSDCYSDKDGGVERRGLRISSI